MRNLKGFTLIELLIVVAIIAILAAIAVPNFLEAQVRSKVSRVRADHRSIATAVETYYLDNNLYPCMWGGTSPGANGTSADSITPKASTWGDSRTFRLRGNSALSTLTTPVSYITSYFGDPFADTRGLPFRYYTDRAGFLLGSFGPDADEGVGGDLGWNQGTYVIIEPREDNKLESVYDSRRAEPGPLLLTGANGSATGRAAYTYDPTNGTVSQGDVWRTKD